MSGQILSNILTTIDDWLFQNWVLQQILEQEDSDWTSYLVGESCDRSRLRDLGGVDFAADMKG